MPSEIYPSDYQLTNNTEVFLIKKEPFAGNFVKCSIISVNERNKTPFQKCVIPTDVVNNFKFCAVIEMSANGNWTQKYDYSKHKYDCVSVLDKYPNKLVVFGNKIGERKIKINDEFMHIERGDCLLLDTHNDTIVHNVTRAKIIYETIKAKNLCNNVR